MIRHKATNSSPSAGSVSMKLKCLICTFVREERRGTDVFSTRIVSRVEIKSGVGKRKEKGSSYSLPSIVKRVSNEFHCPF